MMTVMKNHPVKKARKPVRTTSRRASARLGLSATGTGLVNLHEVPLGRPQKPQGDDGLSPAYR
jgi:hypothetical protein